MQNLVSTIIHINQQNVAGQIWVDGSFLTEKLNPDDADIVYVITGAVYAGMATSQRTFFDTFRRTDLYPKYKIDNYGIVLDPNGPEGLWWQSYWVRQFGFSRANEMKGILRVTVPFLVSP